MAGQGAGIEQNAAVATAVERATDSGPTGDISTGTDSYVDGLAPDAGADRDDVLAMLGSDMEEPGVAPDGAAPDGASPDGPAPDGTGPDVKEAGPLVDLGDIPKPENHKERNEWIDEARTSIKEGVEKVQALLKEKAELKAQARLEQLKKLLEKAQEEERKGAIKAITKEITQQERVIGRIESDFKKKLQTQLKRSEGVVDRTERDETDRQRLDAADRDSTKETKAAERGFRNIDNMGDDLSKQFEKLQEEVGRMKALAEAPESTD